MPVKRRVAKVRDNRITPEAVAAFKAGDDTALRQALGLKPWQSPTLPKLDEENPWTVGTSGWEWWPLGQALRRELEAAAK